MLSYTDELFTARLMAHFDRSSIEWFDVSYTSDSECVVVFILAVLFIEVVIDALY
jgi:hypothetical protein